MRFSFPITLSHSLSLSLSLSVNHLFCVFLFLLFKSWSIIYEWATKIFTAGFPHAAVCESETPGPVLIHDRTLARSLISPAKEGDEEADPMRSATFRPPVREGRLHTVTGKITLLQCCVCTCIIWDRQTQWTPVLWCYTVCLYMFYTLRSRWHCPDLMDSTRGWE